METISLIFASEPLEMEGSDRFIIAVSPAIAEDVIVRLSDIAESRMKAQFGERWPKFSPEFYAKDVQVTTDVDEAINLVLGDYLAE
jgi:hypothetical protein